jgi:hypothetical protein
MIKKYCDEALKLVKKIMNYNKEYVEELNGLIRIISK